MFWLELEKIWGFLVGFLRMSGVNNSVETVNAAATAIVSAESRVQQIAVEVYPEIRRPSFFVFLIHFLSFFFFLTFCGFWNFLLFFSYWN